MRHQTPAVQAWREKDGSCRHCGEQLDPPPPARVPGWLPQDWWTKYGPRPPTLTAEEVMAPQRGDLIARYIKDRARQLRGQG